MTYLIVTARSLIWILLSLFCTLLMLSAILSPSWIAGTPQKTTINNETVVYTPSLGVYAKCDKPVGKHHSICTLMSARGLSEDSEYYPGAWKAAMVFLTMGICFILGVMLHPMAWGTNRVHTLCGRDSSPFLLGDCSIGTGLYFATSSTILTFLCACLSVPAEKSTSSDKVQDKIYDGQTLICLT
ncbi:LHFPL tetraspan subfamily member 2a protein isoform X2 [Anthonomus grandis grandis]|uniref:LHFPL tetraspan subfamily member 2a protein isoform X2 n=1 Tax=Anthonomus grandis grandis TaxID=2921223 RepID=UPI0021650807|nr:LHFPL tetraspan subfamily member 2a protein isoform X2 [Anthonomus grandis grandis]